MTSSDSRTRARSDRLRQIRTMLEVNPVPALLVVALVLGVGAGLLAPEVSDREQANSLVGLFVGLLAANATVLALYVGINKRIRKRLRKTSLIVLGAGCLVCVA